MFPLISARVKLLQAKRREIRAKIHRTLIVALIAPLFVTISAAPPALAATYAAPDSYCSQTMTGSTDVTVTHVGNSCVVVFKATAANATTTFSWTVPSNASTVSILVIGGGGSGGTRHAAGGGAGGFVYRTAVSVTPATTVSISVGKGGNSVGPSNSNGDAGTASTFGGTSAAGGGFGGQSSSGGNGGSGGGGCCAGAAGNGNTPALSPSQGNNGGVGTRGTVSEAGWSGGGGGGSGSTGFNSTSTASIGGAGDYGTSGSATGGKGGNGTINAITGSDVCYAAGGGGGVAASSANGGAGGQCGSTTIGGLGGKGANATSPNYLPLQGVDATGSGGGGGGFEGGSNAMSGRGGSGIVVVRYDLPVVTISANSGTGSPSATTLNVNSNNQVTLPTKNTLTRDGYSFGGWNTATDGTGTNYAEGAAYTPTGNVTLHARWFPIATFNGNSQSTENSTVPAPINVTSASANNALPIPYSLRKGNYRFGGWNTNSTGTGTNTNGSNVDIYDLAEPYLRLEAANYNTSTNVWTATNGADVPASKVKSPANISKVTNFPTSGVGGTETFTALRGTTAAGIALGNAPLSNGFTFCTVARPTTIQSTIGAGNGGRIFDGVTGNWLVGWWAGYQGSFYHEGWMNNPTTVRNTNFHVVCDRPANNRFDGVQVGTTGSGSPILPEMSINNGNTTGGSTITPASSLETSPWEVAEVIIYDRTLGDTDVLKVESYLKYRYGVTAATNGSYTLGSATASYGTATPQTVFAQWNSVITFDANSATTGIAPANQTITGTGAALSGNTGSLAKGALAFLGWYTNKTGTGGTFYAAGATYPNSGSKTLYAVYGPALSISGGSTATFASGTGGKSETFTVSGGVGTRVVTNLVSPANSGITLDSSIANSIVINVASTVAQGTYIDTITVRDDGFTTTKVITITVAAPLIWSGGNPSSITTTFGKYSRTRLDLSGGSGTRIATLVHSSSPAPRGVSLDTSSLASGVINFIVDTGTAIGTYMESITVTDGTGVIKTTILMLTINPPPEITYSVQTDAIFPYVTQNLLLNLDVANPNSYSGTGTTWTDTAGGRAFTLSGSPIYSQDSGGTLAFASGKEAVSNTNWTNLETFTVETWFKLNSLSASIPCFVTSTYSSTHINFAICQWGTGTLVGGYHIGGVGWQGYVSVANVLTTNTWNHAAYSVSKSGSTYTATLYLNGVAIGSATSTYAPQTQAGPLRIGKRWDLAEYIDGNIPVVRIYNASLTAEQIRQNYQNSKVRFVSATAVSPTNSGKTSLTVTAGTARDFQLFTGNDGVGTKTFTLSGANSNFRIDTSTANTAIFKVLASTTANSASSPKTYYETLTAVDSNSIATAYYLTVTANPVILITTTSDTVTTTFGKAGSTTLNVAVNTGTGASTFTRVSSSGSSAITASLSAGQAVLNIANTLPAGTYFETLTATDSVGATAFRIIKIIVNPALTISSNSGSTQLATTYGKAASLRLNFTGGTGNLSFGVSSVSSNSIWKFSVDTSTVALGYVTFRVGSYATVGTHITSISVTDSLSTSSTLQVTTKVNENPRINGNATPNSYTSNSLIVNLDAANSDSYPGSGTTWNEVSGNNGNFIFQGSPTYSTLGGGSIVTATNNFVQSVNNPTGLTEFTIESWFNLSSLNTAGTYPCLLSSTIVGSNINYFLCLFNSSGTLSGGYYSGGWYGQVSTSSNLAVNTWYHAAYKVTKTGNSYVGSLYLNGALVGNSSSTTTAPPASAGPILVGKRWGVVNEFINGRIQVARIYNRTLSDDEITANYNAFRARLVTNANAPTTIATTQGVATSNKTITASLGTGDFTFGLSPDLSASGITGDFSQSGVISINTDSRITAIDSQTARTYVETLTATDAAGATATHQINIVVNPPIILASGSTSIATTSGIETSTVITASRGSSVVTFTRTGTSTSGITLTAVANQATLRVLSTINPGTYYETVTATDTASATTSMMFTIVVAAPPSLLGVSRLETTKGVLFNSPIYAISGGTGSLTMTVTNSPANVNISLAGVTSLGGYLQVASETGTYTSTIRVTDARGAFSEIAVTVIVNAPVTLSGSLSITKTYGNSTTNGYSTNGTGKDPFSFSSTPVCAVVRTVSGSFTYEKINGTDSCTWTAPFGVTAVDALLVGGGGGGGGDGGAGGGGGSINTLTSASLPANRQLTVQVGAGGTGGVWGGDAATAGGTTSITSGSTTYTAPGGSAGGGCGAAAAPGGVTGSGGSPTAGGNGGFGANGSCNVGTGNNGSNGPSSNFMGTGAVNYGGGGGGGPYLDGIAPYGGKTGGTGGGGTGAISKGIPSLGLIQYFRTQTSQPSNASAKEGSFANACAIITGNINYSADIQFPCSQKENFQGHATGYFIAPVSGTITFHLSSDDSSLISLNGPGGNVEKYLSIGSTTLEVGGFVKDQAYPINVYFTEIGGIASWNLAYSWTGQAQTIIPITQFRSWAEGLGQYFRTTASPANANTKPTFTTGTCSERVGNIDYANDDAFACSNKDNFQVYATGFFVAPYTGDIKFYLNSDDSSHMAINVNGSVREFSADNGESNATYSGFVKGQFYPISAYFTENGGLASWKLSYEYPGQGKIAIPVGYLRSTADFTAPTDGTNGLGGGGGGGTAGIYKITGARGGSGTAIIKYLTQSESATAAMITAVVNQETPSGLLTLNVPANVTVGTYTQVIKVLDAVNSAPYSATVTITVNKATPTATLSLPGSVTTATYGTPVTLSVRASTPGNVAFKKSGTALTNCSSVATSNGVATCSWTPNVVETASISVLLSPTDSTNYNNSVETASALTIVVGKADTLTVTAGNITTTYSEDGSGNPNTTVASPTFTHTGLASIDSITAMSYAYTGTQNNGTNYASSPTAPKLAGTYSIAPGTPVFTSPGTTSNYKNVTFAPGTLTINRKGRGSWTLTYGSGANIITYGASKQETPTVTYPGDGTRSFTTTSSVCSVNASTGVITTLGVGSCDVTAVLSQTSNWLSDTLTATVTINRGPRVATITPAKTTIRYGETTTVTSTVTQALDSATVTFSAGSFLGCAVDNVTGEVTGIRAGASCAVSVSYSQTDLYESATASSAMTINRALAPVVTTEAITAVSYTGNTAIVTPSYRVSGILARDILQILPTADVSNISIIDPTTYSRIASYRYFATVPTSYDSTTAPSLGGTYSVTPQTLTLLSGVDISNYETPTFVSSNLVINPIAQAALRILLSAQESITVPYDITFAGGSSTGSISAVIVSGGSATGCSISVLRLSTSSPGTCILRATKAADRNYLEVVSDTATVTILNFVSSIDWNAVFNSGSGITITSEVPITKGPTTCDTGCIPVITDIQTNSGVSTTTLVANTPIRIYGSDLSTTTFVYFTARINGVRLSSVPADSVQIDSDTQLTVMPPASFVPNTGENTSNIAVRIVVVTPGGQTASNQIIIISL